MHDRTCYGTLKQWLGNHTLPSDATYDMLNDVRITYHRMHALVLRQALLLQLLKGIGLNRPQAEELMADPFFASM